MNTLSHWILAARPKTLSAAFVPVAVATALATTYDYSIYWSAVIIALLCALLIQIGTNFANDYFDFKKGADSTERIGFVRATASGLISESQMKKATIFTFVIAFFLGLYLVWHGGWIILMIGLLSILFGILYTGGPFPLAYNGLGDIFVFIFFGLIAVHGTFFVATLTWVPEVTPAAMAVGALAVNILVVNNLRDVDSDRKVAKRTLGVIFGENFLKMEYVMMLLIAWTVPFWYVLTEDFKVFVLLPLLTIFPGIALLRVIFTETDKSQLNQTLEKTAKLLVLWGLLFIVGVLI